MEKIVYLKDIRIKHSFRKTLPKAKKINICYDYYRKNQKFDRDIVVNEKGVLQDGYVAYLVAKMVGCTTVRVKIIDNKKIEIAA